MSSGEILIIDDDEMILLLAQTMLQEGGFDVVTTADGPQGVELYYSHRPDVVLLDLGLPRMNGMAVLARILEMNPRAKVIVVTGYGSDKTADEAMKGGAMDFISKPFNPKILLEKVRLAIEV